MPIRTPLDMGKKTLVEIKKAVFCELSMGSSFYRSEVVNTHTVTHMLV